MASHPIEVGAAGLERIAAHEPDERRAAMLRLIAMLRRLRAARRLRERRLRDLESWPGAAEHPARGGGGPTGEADDGA